MRLRSVVVVVVVEHFEYNSEERKSVNCRLEKPNNRQNDSRYVVTRVLLYSIWCVLAMMNITVRALQESGLSLYVIGRH